MLLLCLVPATLALEVGSGFKQIDIKDTCHAMVATEDLVNSLAVARALADSLLWQPCADVKLARGYISESLWIKFEFSNSSLYDKSVYINIFPSWITKISQYSFSEGYLVHKRSDGIVYEYNKREVPSSNFVLPIDLSPGQKITTLLHITNNQSFLFGGQVLAEKEALKSGLNMNVMNGLLMGSIIIIGIYNLFIFISLRDSNYFYYFLYNLSMLLMLSIIYGFGYQYFWPEHIKFNTFMESAAGPTLSIFMSLFVRRFLNLAKVSPVLDNLLLYFIFISVAVVLLSLVPFLQDETSAWSGFLAVVGAPVVILAGVKAVMKRQPSSGYFLVAWLLSLVSITLFGLMLAGVLEFNLVLFYSFGIGAVLEMLLLSFALANKIHYLQLEKAQAIDALLKSEKENSKRIALAASQLEHKVSVRTHDLAQEKRRAEVLARTDPLTGLNNRRAFFEKGEKLFTDARLSSGRKSLALIMVDIDHFKKVNDKYGHSTGDIVITAVALKLLPCFLGESVIGRIGGEEFAIAIEDEDFDEVIARAEFARQSISQTLTAIANGEDVAVTISIGIAQFRETDQNIDETLARADMALYQAKEQGRDRVISVP